MGLLEMEDVLNEINGEIQNLNHTVEYYNLSDEIKSIDNKINFR